MRMRKKPNLIPRMEKCAHVQIREPEAMRGHWLSEFVGYKELHLELGCGKGRFTVEMAIANQDVLFVGVEKVPDAMVVAMERAVERRIENIRFLDFDAVNCRNVFAPEELSRIYINFPDPWRKSRQYKRRLTAPSFLEIYKEILRAEGEVWFKTDNRPLFDWSLEQFDVCGWWLSNITNDLHTEDFSGAMTDYEAKFREQGISINRLVAKKAGNI